MTFDLKCQNLTFGKGNSASMFPCGYCDACKWSEDGQPTTGRGLFNTDGKLLTYDMMKEEAKKFIDGGSKPADAMKHKSCIRMPIPFQPQHDGDLNLVRFPIPILHSGLLGK